MKAILLALGAGALAMYLADREQGPQRRARIREKLDRAGSQIRGKLSSRTQTHAETREPVQPAAE